MRSRGGTAIPSFNVGLWAPDGRRTLGPTVGGEIVPDALRAWPNGLLTMLRRCDKGGRESFVLRRFDFSLNELAKASVTFACVDVAGVVEDANRNLLLLVSGTGAAADGFAGDDLVGSWFDADRKPLTGWFRVAPGGATTASRWRTR